MMSPTLAFLVSTTPSKGARMSVCSTVTLEARTLASATPMEPFNEATAARALSARAALAASGDAPEMKFLLNKSSLRFRFASESRASATLFQIGLRCAQGGLRLIVGSRDIQRSRYVPEPGRTSRQNLPAPKYSKCRWPLVETAALRCGNAAGRVESRNDCGEETLLPRGWFPPARRDCRPQNHQQRNGQTASTMPMIHFGGLPFPLKAFGRGRWTIAEIGAVHVGRFRKGDEPIIGERRRLDFREVRPATRKRARNAAIRQRRFN